MIVILIDLYKTNTSTIRLHTTQSYNTQYKLFKNFNTSNQILKHKL
jgi:hypothetical protein